LLPEALAERAQCDQWMDWQATEFSPGLRDAFWQLIRTPLPERQAAVIDASVRRCEPLLAILDEALAGKSFLTGDSFTMADIPVGCTVHRWFGLPIERIGRPNVERWYARLKQRPAARQVLDLPLT
jgi:glutathione S-transferase